MDIQKEAIYYPTLETILVIEEIIKKANNPVSRKQILVRLKNKAIIISTLNFTLDYMENSGMILETRKGFIWTFNPNKRLKTAEQEGLSLC